MDEVGGSDNESQPSQPAEPEPQSDDDMPPEMTPTSSRQPLQKKRKRQPAGQQREDAELAFMKSVTHAMADKEDVEDDINLFCRNLETRLRKIKDPMALFMLQNELEQCVFRAVVAQGQQTRHEQNSDQGFSFTNLLQM